MAKYLMFGRMVVASLLRRKSRVAITFAVIAVGVAVISGLGSVYYDVGYKMRRELRTYGANLVLTPAASDLDPYMALSEISEIAARIDGGKLVGYVSYLYGVATLRSHEAVVAGLSFDQVQAVSPYWKVKANVETAQGEASALVGELLAERLSIKPGETIELAAKDGSKAREVVVSGILSTGGQEDSLIFVDLDLASDLFDRPGLASVAYFSVLGSLQDLESLAQRISAEFAEIAANPVKRISQSEGRVLEKISSLVLLSVATVLLLTLLSVAIAMMNMAAERRREIGLRKALGALDRDILLEFFAEGSTLGLAGGLLGWGLGQLFAQAVERSVFQSSVALRLELLPITVLVSAALAGLATLIPAKAAAMIEPAATLRGD